MKQGYKLRERRPDYLVLVNPSHPMLPDFLRTVELVSAPTVGGRNTLLEKATLAAYEALRVRVAEAGIQIGIDSAFRTCEDQERIIRELSETYGVKYARRTAALPGTSEHHTGLAIDLAIAINGEWSDGNEIPEAEEALFEKIHTFLSAFGFILRYPRKKEDICGYGYEPWHIRYVGSKEIAGEIMNRGITLEEYLGDGAMGKEPPQDA